MLTKNRQRELDFHAEYEKFINDSGKGRRLQPNGKRISAGTIANYYFTLNVVRQFCEKKQFELRIRPAQRLNTRQLERERNYWKKFYRLFTDYLYNECGYFDNYAGQIIKNIRTFFNYLDKERSLGVGNFRKLFYVRKEEISIFPLMPDELNFLAHDPLFESSLTPRMPESYG